MTATEKKIIELILKNPNLKQEEIADILETTRNSVAVHINNLTKKGIILGRKYIINENKLEEDTTLFDVQEESNISYKNLLFISGLSKYIYLDTNESKIKKRDRLSSNIYFFIEYIVKSFNNNDFNISFITNIDKVNCYDIIIELKKLGIDYSLSNFLEDETVPVYYCIDKKCFLETDKFSEIEVSDYSKMNTYDVIFSDDSISIKTLQNLVFNSNSLMFWIDKDYTFLNSLFELVKEKNNVDYLIVNYNTLNKVFNNTDFDFIEYKLLKVLKFKNIIIYTNNGNIKIISNNKNISTIQNINEVIYNEIFF